MNASEPHPSGPVPDPDLVADWARLVADSQRVAQEITRAQADGEQFSLIDLPAIAQAFTDVWLKLAENPTRLAEAQIDLWQANVKLWKYWSDRIVGHAAEPLVEPDRGDRRFADKAWREAPAFDCIKQSYLLTARWLRTLVHEVEGIDPHEKEMAEFYTRQYLSALSPSNFAATNPAVLRQTIDTGGRNLVDGMKHLLHDLEEGHGRLKIAMTDPTAFKVGRNVATTPGKVIFQNELMQLIQYAPATDTVFRRPVLYVPHWINKFYVADLQPRNSLIKWIVDQGHTLFVISWANPGPELAEKSFDDYLRDGPLAALDAIEAATGELEVNLIGFCIGGILCVTLLAWLAAKGEGRVTSGTALATLIDFRDVGEASVFIDERQLERIERYVAEKGYLEAHHLADMFSLMRENDLVWSFVVSNYLMGREPIPFDLLYWNSDPTRLPARMLVDYVRDFYLENRLVRPGGLTIAGEPIDLGRIRVPAYFLATRDDHITPWTSCYPATQALKGSDVRFVLGGSGHVAGIINPPSAKKYGHWTNPQAPPDPQAWLESATFNEGSWWPDWGAWLAEKGGEQVPARQPGDGKLKPIEDAPGSYVLVRAEG